MLRAGAAERIAAVSAGTLHSVIGLGTDGGQELADGDQLARGVHLRWPLTPGLGFPVGGYHVSRRNHRNAEWVCLLPEDGLMPPDGGVTSWESLDFEFGLDRGGAEFEPDLCPPSGAVHLPGRRALRIRSPFHVAAIRASGSGTPPLLEVFGETGGALQLLARRRAARSDDELDGHDLGRRDHRLPAERHRHAHLRRLLRHRPEDERLAAAARGADPDAGRRRRHGEHRRQPARAPTRRAPRRTGGSR